MSVREFRELVDKGFGYSASERFENVADGASVNMLISNPSYSRFTCYIISIEVISWGQGHADLIKNVSYSGGTEVRVFNLNVAGRESPSLMSSPEIQYVH